MKMKHKRQEDLKREETLNSFGLILKAGSLFLLDTF